MSDNETPCYPVSVLMTVYNGGQFLEPAIQSIFDQSLQDFEFVIVNDGSTDGSGDLLDSISDPRVRIVHQENQGTAAAANHGLQFCTGKYVARMDCDDIALPERLKKQREFLDSNPDVGIVGSQIACLGSRSVGKSLKIPTEHEKIFAALMKSDHGMAHNSIMIRHSVLKQIGGYWKLRLIDDWDMMLRMGEVSKLANLNEVLLHYRVHQGSLNGTSLRRLHLHYGYSIECAKRRQSGQAPINFDDFVRLRQGRSSWEKFVESMNLYSLTQYRIAVAEMQGTRPLIGKLRLLWAAVCGPGRTFKRLGRILGT